MSDQVMVRDVAIGGGAPVSIQSMTNVDSRDEKALLRQIQASTRLHSIRFHGTGRLQTLPLLFLKRLTSAL